MRKVPAVSPEYRSLNRAMGAINENFDELTPVTGIGKDGEIVRQVGPGLDFETFHEGMVWATTVPVTGVGIIVLELVPGLHFIGSGLTTGTYPTYIIANRAIMIRQTQAVPKAIITVSEDTIRGFVYMFQISSGGNLILLNIDIDAAAGNYNFPSEVAGIYAIRNSYITLAGNTNIIAGDPITLSSATALITTPCSLTTITPPGAPTYEACLSAYTLSGVFVYTYFEPLYLAGENIGLEVDDNSSIGIQNGKVAYAPEIDIQTNVPLNQIQYDGSFISDQSGPLSFKP